MKKRIVSIVLLVCILASALVMNAAAVYTPKYTDYADALFGLELFLGNGIQADGTPDYNLESGITRAQCIVMLLRLLGEENAALSAFYNDPFKDMDDHWATRYVSYAYEMGYTSGTAADAFSPETIASGKMYLTFLLRALGYNDRAGDFDYNTAYEMAAELGLCPKGAYTTDATFYRDDCVFTSYNALCTKMKGSDLTLLDTLVEKGAVEADKAELFMHIGKPSGSDALLDLSVFYHVGLSYSQIKNLFPKGFYGDNYGYCTGSMVADKFSQINFRFENGTDKPSTGADGRLRQIMFDSTRRFSANELAAAIGGEVLGDRIEADFNGSTLTIYPDNGAYTKESKFDYVDGTAPAPTPDTDNAMTNADAQTMLKDYWGTHCAAGGAWYYFADVSGDGIDEMFNVVFDEWDDGLLGIYMVLDGEVVQIAEKYTSSMNSYQIGYYLYTENGRNYILEHNSFLRQGYGQTYYKIYSYTADGAEVILRENSFSGEMNAAGEAASNAVHAEYMKYKAQSKGIMYQTLNGGASDLL